MTQTLSFTPAEIQVIKSFSADELKILAKKLGIAYKTKKDFVKLFNEMQYDDSKAYDVIKHTLVITKADEIVMVSPRVDLKNQTTLRLSESMVIGLFEAKYIVGYVNHLGQSTYY